MLAFDSIRDLDIINDELRLEDEDEEFYKKIYGVVKRNYSCRGEEISLRPSLRRNCLKTRTI